MPAIKSPAPILYLASEPSFFAIMDEKGKEVTLKDVTRIDFPLIEKGEINKENLTHALKSLEQTTLHVVLSDEVFYHHISDYTLTGKKDIEDEIKETVGTVFADKTEPLHIVTVDLAKTSKMQTVQITAMTKANLATLAEAAEETGVTIESILPASFVVKAFVSVDPSLFLLATSQSFLLTSHYIGVDFAHNLSSDDNKALFSTIRTLKKERPHIQHIYLCAHPDQIASLHEELSDVLPVQDVELKEVKAERDTPFFLKAVILGVKEVVENDFPLPQFSVKSAEKSVKNAEASKVSPANDEEEINEEEAVKVAIVTDESEEDPIKKVKAMVEDETEEIEDAEVEEEKKEERSESRQAKEVEEKVSDLPAPTILKTSESKSSETASEIAVTTVSEAVTITQPEKIVAPVAAATVASATSKVMDAPKHHAADDHKHERVEKKEEPSESRQEEEVKAVEVPESITVSKSTTVATASAVRTATSTKKKTSVFKYVLLALGVALAISLVGGGVVISQQALSDQKAPLQTPVVSVTPSEEEPTPTPEPTAAPVDLKTAKILVVNATSVAGKAGKVATAVKKTGATTVDSGNAKDDYSDAGNFVMFAKPEFKGAKTELEEATGLTLEEEDMSSTENTGGKYDIVIVLNE